MVIGAGGFIGSYIVPLLAKKHEVITIYKNSIDILDNFKLPKVNFVVGDIFDDNLIENLPVFDLVCSDIAPNLSGNKFIDQAKIMDLCERSMFVAMKKLKSKGIFITKIFEGQGFSDFLKLVKKNFKYMDICKPKSSRKESHEVYIIAMTKRPLKSI